MSYYRWKGKVKLKQTELFGHSIRNDFKLPYRAIRQPLMVKFTRLYDFGSIVQQYRLRPLA